MREKKMSLEDYKKKVEECLIQKLKLSTKVAKQLMKEYEKGFQGYYEDDLTVEEMATCMFHHY